MGSGDSKQGQAQGEIYISLDSNNVMSGGFIRGSVHIALAEQLTNPALYLIFKGNELTKFRIQHHRQKKTYYTKHFGKHRICALKASLYQWPDLLAYPGNFSFPFELKIYDNLLPSFHAYGRWKSFCKIVYSIRAQLHATDRKPLKFKAPIFVFANSMTLPQEMYPQAISQDLPGRGSLLCCFNKEHATPRIWIERGTFGNTDFIDISLETNLSGFSGNITRVYIEVRKILTMRANRTKARVYTQAAIMFTSEDKVNIQANSGVQRFKFRIPVQSMLDDEHCYTLASQLIQCYFEFSFKLHTGIHWFKCFEFKRADQEFVILPFQMQAPMIPPPIAPDQWKAQLLPQSSIDPYIQDANNPNPLIVKSFTDQPGPSDKVTSCS